MEVMYAFYIVLATTVVGVAYAAWPIIKSEFFD